jgi:hypothetical protein
VASQKQPTATSQHNGHTGNHNLPWNIFAGEYPELHRSGIAARPSASAINPNTGTQIRIKSISAKGGLMQLEVRPAK